VLAALGPDGLLVNIARGSVVDQDALSTALRTGTIEGAGLDVFADEPNVPAALLAMPNVMLLPHVGAGWCAKRAVMSTGKRGRPEGRPGKLGEDA
jgi:lactate dehydrogenase-like 2-hydroxyacid dehydrogenase